MGDDGGSPFETCANCGRRLGRDEWHPVAMEKDEAGDVELYSFCDESCQTEWG